MQVPSRTVAAGADMARKYPLWVGVGSYADQGMAI
jgi:hypothetical protein